MKTFELTRISLVTATFGCTIGELLNNDICLLKIIDKMLIFLTGSRGPRIQTSSLVICDPTGEADAWYHGKRQDSLSHS